MSNRKHPEHIKTEALINAIKKIMKQFPDVEWRLYPHNPEYVVGDDGTIISCKRGNVEIMKGYISKSGRSFHHVDGVKRHTARIVALTFHADTYFEGAEADHKDDNPTGPRADRASNLQWLSHTDNIRKSYGLPLGKTWKVRDPQGVEFIVERSYVFAKKHKLPQSAFSELLNETPLTYYKKLPDGSTEKVISTPRKSVKGWTLVKD